MRSRRGLKTGLLLSSHCRPLYRIFFESAEVAHKLMDKDKSHSPCEYACGKGHVKESHTAHRRDFKEWMDHLDVFFSSVLMVARMTAKEKRLGRVGAKRYERMQEMKVSDYRFLLVFCGCHRYNRRRCRDIYALKSSVMIALTFRP